MDILDESGAQSFPVDLDDLVTTSPLPSTPPPVPATRNQATITTMLGNTEDPQGTYNTIMGEAQEGSTQTQDLLKQEIKNNAQASNQKSLMGVLADPSLAINQKQQALNNYKLPALSDTSAILHSQLLQKSSPGESVDGEDARISTAATIQSMYDSRTQIQNMANALKDKADNTDAATKFFDAAANLIPGRQLVQTNKMLDALSQATGVDRQWWKNLSVMIGSGAQTQDAAQMIQQLPPDKQLQVAKAMFNSVQNRSGFLYGNDNQHEAYDWFNKLFSADQYGVGSASIDNITGLLDMAFLGQTGKDIGLMGKNIARMVTGGSGAIDANEAAQFAKANAGPIASTVRNEPTVGTGNVVNDVTEPTYTAARQVAQDEPQVTGATQAAMNRANQATSNVTPVANNGALLGGSGQSLSQVGTKSQAALLGGGRAVEDIKQTMARMSKQSPVLDINPNSPMEIAQNANPASARQMNQAIIQGSEEVAQALTGVSKEQAVQNAVMPQVTESGTVFSRASDIDQPLRVASQDANIAGIVDTSSVNAFTPFERASILSRVVNDFGNAQGLTHNDAMSSVVMEGNRLKINQVYEVPGGSFSNAQQAFDQAKYALRQYGVTDNDITILRKNGVNHEPVALDQAKDITGDYKIQVKVNPEVSPSFLDEMENLSVKKNFFDRFAGTQWGNRGSLNRNLVDVASMLSQHISGPASIAKDYGARFEKQMLGKANDFANMVKKFEPARQDKIQDYIREANFKGIPFDQGDLLARGFNQSEINSIAKWRSFWDDHHYLENLDIVRSLRNQGYEYFKNANAELYARPIGKVQNVSRFYDPASDSVRGFTAGELDSLYNSGGTLLRLRRPTSFGGEEVEHMISRQTATEYSRALVDSDSVLNKLNGYYSISYKNAKFIDEVDDLGRKVRTVAVAGNTPEGKAFITRMQANNQGKKYILREDTRKYRFNSDENWDINSARGRIAQRHRGQLLEGADQINHIGDMTYVESPAASAERAAKSIAGRTVMRPMLDTATQRFMKQYADILPRDMYGQTRFPQSAEEIGALGRMQTSEAADARTTWEYLNYLRRGYINSVNDGTKAVFNVLANAAGERGFGKTEEVLGHLGEMDVLNKLKRTTFNAYLASNPLRQVFTQSAQAWRVFGYNPMGIIKGGIPKLITEFYDNHAFGGAQTPFVKFMESSGFADAVKHHNLVASSLQSLADRQSLLSKGYQAGVNTLRRVGFDSGELANMVAHSAAVFDRYKALGRDVTNRQVQEDMHSEIRALTYDMNAAGDMPYNQGSLSAMLQFMQMPHKAWLQYTNRRLDLATKARMAVGDLLLWGAGIDVVSSALNTDILPRDDTNGNELLHDGAVSMLYNHAMNTLFEGSHKMDYSALSPYGLDGWMKLWHNIMGQGLWAGVLNSPSSSFLGNRVAKVATEMASFFNPKPWDSRQTPEKFVDTMMAVGSLSSGFSNAHKAWLVHEYGERRDAYGTLIDSNTTTGDSIAQAFGFTSQKEAMMHDVQNQLSEDANAKKREVTKVYKTVKQFYADHYYDNDNPDIDFMTGVTGGALKYYQNDPEAMRMIQDMWKRDSVGPDAPLTLRMMRSMNVPGDNDYRTRIQNGPWDDNTKKQMNQYLDYARDAQKVLNQQTGKE